MRMSIYLLQEEQKKIKEGGSMAASWAQSHTLYISYASHQSYMYSVELGNARHRWEISHNQMVRADQEK